MDYSFLKNLTLVDTGRLKQPKTKNPTGLTVRVFADGSIYPSQALTDKFNLEYTHATNPNQGNGLDIVDTAEWNIFAGQPRIIMFGITDKSNPKVDLFASCRHNDDGTPKSSVMTQGSVNTYLLDLVKECGWLTENQKYVDLKVMEEHPFKTADGLAFIPKTIVKGAKAGDKTYSRRENATFYPVEPTDLPVANTNTSSDVTVLTVNPPMTSNQIELISN